MELGLIHHVGYVVADLDAEIAVYRDTLGMPVGVREVMPEQGVEAVAFNFGAGNFGSAAHYADFFPETFSCLSALSLCWQV